MIFFYDFCVFFLPPNLVLFALQLGHFALLELVIQLHHLVQDPLRPIYLLGLLLDLYFPLQLLLVTLQSQHLFLLLILLCVLIDVLQPDWHCQLLTLLHFYLPNHSSPIPLPPRASYSMPAPLFALSTLTVAAAFPSAEQSSIFASAAFLPSPTGATASPPVAVESVLASLSTRAKPAHPALSCTLPGFPQPAPSSFHAAYVSATASATSLFGAHSPAASPSLCTLRC